MSRVKRLEQWHTPDTPGDRIPVKPPGELLVGRDQLVELRYFSIRQRETGVSLNFYSRKTNSGVPAYGITVTPEEMLRLCRKGIEVAEAVLQRQGKRVEGK